MSGLTVARQAVAPTAAAVPWTPLLVVAAVLIAGTGLTGALSDRPGPLAALAAGALAAGAVAALRDPADRLLAALPTSRLARRLLRLALVSGPMALALVAVSTLSPGPPAPWSSTAALTLAGLAAATWLPERRILLAAGAPLVWVCVTELLDATAGPLDWWHGRPWLVAAVAAALVVAGRHR